MELTHAAEKLVVHWGEMGSRWGVNRTVAQIHALLLLAPRPMSAAEVADTLSVARSNVSTSLRELQAWGVVRVTHVLGDRRDYFDTVTDIWQLFRIILEERWRREIEPVFDVLEECLEEVPARGDNSYMKVRLEELESFFRTMETWYRQLIAMQPHEIRRVARMGGKMKKLVRVIGGTRGER